MNRPLPALEYRKVRDHGIPVMLRERRRIFPAVLQERAPPKHQRKSLPRPFCRDYAQRRWLVPHPRQVPLQFLLRVPKLRTEMDALHHHRLLLAVIEARKPQHPALVDAGLVPAELRRQPLLHPPEVLHLRIPHKPVGMQGFAGLHNERGLQRERFNLIQLFVQG